MGVIIFYILDSLLKCYEKIFVYLYFWLKSVLRIRDILVQDPDPRIDTYDQRILVRIREFQNTKTYGSWADSDPDWANNKQGGSGQIYNAFSHPGLDLDKPPSVKE